MPKFEIKKGFQENDKVIVDHRFDGISRWHGSEEETMIQLGKVIMEINTLLERKQSMC